jgi:energy-converting hydrogenase Eha subunit C
VFASFPYSPPVFARTVKLHYIPAKIVVIVKPYSHGQAEIPMTKPEVEKAGFINRAIGRLRSRRFAYLAKSLVILILAYPYLEVNVRGQLLLTIITIFVMMSLIIAVSDSKRSIIITLCLGLPWFASLIVNFPVFENAQTVFIRKEILFAVLLFSYTTFKIFMHLLRSREVTSEILFASVCVYLLIGLTWSSFYIFIDYIYPHSFIDTSDLVPINAPRILFFSYITLTTVGYGTLIPVSDPARSLALLEAIIGQLYLAILVARLVGLHISKPRATDL